MWFWTNVYVQQGKTYAIQYSDSTIHLRYAFSTEAITEYSSDVFANTTTIQNKFATFTATETGYLRIVFSLPVNTPDGTIDRLQVIEGSYTADTLPEYEPYGYKVSGRAEGLNLLDVSGSTSILNGDTVVDGDTITFTTTDNCYGIKFATLTLEPNTEYTLSYQSVNFDGNYTDSYGLRAVIDNSGVPGGASSYITFTTNETGDVTLSYYVGIPYEGEAGKILTIKGVALYKGSYTAETMPPYEPYQPPQDFAVYLPEQIAKVGNVADEVVVDVERKTAELRKNVGSVVADGDESWIRNDASYDRDDYTNRYAMYSKIKGNSSVLGYLCDKFKRGTGPTWMNANYECFNINTDQLHLTISNTRLGITADDEAADRTTKFKAWLNDNNVTVYAPLATPVTTDITSLQQWDAMPQVKGTVTLTLSAEVDPSGAEVMYYSKERNTE